MKLKSGIAVAASLLTLLVVMVVSPAPVQAQVDPPPVIDWDSGNQSALTDTFIVKKKNFGRTAIEIVGLNLLVWSYDYYIRPDGNDGFRIGFQSWIENLKNGFEWDDNNFNTNQFAHPYHGSLYFNAARSNGYSFWEAVPFTFAGSFGWEYFGETHHPSMNDWIATSVGGTAVGEILHRFSKSIRDNTARGSSRNWRELGGFVVNPVGGLNRIIDGDWARVHANEPDRFPKNYKSQFDTGLRTVGEEEIWSSDTTRVFVQFDFEYGDPFFGDMGKPFDSFDLGLQLNFGDKSVIGRVEVDGLLGGTYLKDTIQVGHIVGAYHHFDFIHNQQIEFGGQSIGAAMLSRYQTVAGMEMRTELHLNGIILGASSTDYASQSGRTYDYGPGLSANLVAQFSSQGFHYLRFSHEQNWLHTVNGTSSEHHLSVTRLRLGVPVHHNIGAGFEYVLMLNEREYRDYPDVSIRRPQTRFFVTWVMN